MKLIAYAVLILFSLVSFAGEPGDELEKATQEIKEFTDSTEVVDQRVYCIAGKLECRVHYRLKNKSDGQIAAGFYFTFVSADRQVGGTGYFLPESNCSDSYKRYEDLNFDGKKVASQIYDPVTVSKDEEGRVTDLMGLVIPRLGTSRYLKADIKITDESVVIEGFEYDKEKPDYKVSVRVQYDRRFL